MGHIDKERYMTAISDDLTNWVYEDPKSYTGFINGEDPAEGESYSEDQIQRMAEGYIEDIEGRLMDWLQGDLGYSGEALAKHLMPYIDEDAAAEDAVMTDGWAHFLSRYDGNYNSTKSGIVYFREA